MGGEDSNSAFGRISFLFTRMPEKLRAVGLQETIKSWKKRTDDLIVSLIILRLVAQTIST